MDTKRMMVVLAVVLAGCGGSGGSGTTAAPTTVVAEPVTTIRTATVGQIASIVGKHNTDLRRLSGVAKTCQFPEDPRCDTAAKISRTSLSTVAATLDVNLRAAAEDRPNNGLFVGAYPAELIRLVANTRSAITEVTTAGEALTKGGCVGGTAAACSGPSLLMSTAASHLVQQLDAWGPYL